MSVWRKCNDVLPKERCRVIFEEEGIPAPNDPEQEGPGLPPR